MKNISLKVYCKGCHTELKEGSSHSCQAKPKSYGYYPFYFRYKGRFVSMKTYE